MPTPPQPPPTIPPIPPRSAGAALTSADAAAPAISRRAADLGMTTKCVETWSQAANGNFQCAVSPAAPLDHPLPLASSRPVDTAASASTDAIPSEPTNTQGSTGPVGAVPSASEAQRLFSQMADHAFRSHWDANLAAPKGTTAGCAAGGAASSTAPIPAPPNATGPADMGQIAAHAAALATTAAAYATVASCTMAVCLNPKSRAGSL